MNVLAIEDNPADAAVLQKMLVGATPGRINLETRGTLAQGLERLVQGGVDVLLLDLVLPDSAGLETFTQVHCAFPVLPIIVLTVLDDEHVAEAALRAGAQDYLTKERISGELLLRAICYAQLRGEADTRIQHLNSVLRAVRNVNQLITHEKDRDALLARSCELLTEARGYGICFIFLAGPPRGFYCASAIGTAAPLNALGERLLSGGSVPCVEAALASSAVTVIENTVDACGECPLAQELRGHCVLAARLHHGGKIHGVICATLIPGIPADDAERSLLSEAAGDIAYALGSLEEEERRKRSEAEIVWLASFPRENPNPVLRVSLDAVLLYANDAAAPLLAAWGCKVGECLPEQPWAPLASALKTGQVTQTEEAHGERVWWLAWSPCIPAGYVNVYARDITERHRAEQALRQSEELYRSLFSNMLNGFAYCRMIFQNGRPHDFIYLRVNDSFESLTGLKNVEGKKVSEVIPGIRESDPGLLEIYGRVASSGRAERFETYVQALRQWFWISA